MSREENPIQSLESEADAAGPHKATVARASPSKDPSPLSRGAAPAFTVLSPSYRLVAIVGGAPARCLGTPDPGPKDHRKPGAATRRKPETITFGAKVTSVRSLRAIRWMMRPRNNPPAALPSRDAFGAHHTRWDCISWRVGSTSSSAGRKAK